VAEIPEIGKVSAEIFSEIIFPRLGAKSSKVLVGPRHGTDVGITEIGGKAVSFTTDPIFIVPEYGWERAAWFAVHILASDSATSGLKPKYLSIDLNLPMSMTKNELSTVWETMHTECEKLGISVITGHTGRYENCHYPMVGGGTVVGIGELGEYVTPAFARPGDRVIITKGPAIEAVGIFAAMFPDVIEKEFGPRTRRQAEAIFYKMTTVEEALTAVTAGVRDNGVSAMHDATECGIWGGLYELADAAGLGVTIEKEKIVVEDSVPEICGYFQIDPFYSISEGTLIILCRAGKAEEVVERIEAKGIKASICGEMTEKSSGMVLYAGGCRTDLVHPVVDPFWRAFYKALGAGQ
jgi:hydrogenase expression/formation protein HypE